MSLYSEIDLTLNVWTDTTKATRCLGLKLDTQFLDAGVPLATGVLPTPSNQGLDVEASGIIKVPPATTDQAFAMQSVVRGQLVVLRCASPFSFKLNSSGNAAITLAPQQNSQGLWVPAFLAMLADNITALYLTNPTPSVIPSGGIAGPLTPYAPIEIYVGIAGIAAV